MPPKLRSVIRLDSMPLASTFYTKEGYLRDKPILTSTGIFEYINPDGSIRKELRLPEEVFDPKSLASYVGKPVVITHDAGLINKGNVHDNQIGTILSKGEQDGDDVRAEIIIHDTEEMKDCGYKELSLGYSLDLDETGGEWEGQRYDAVQRNIRINHLALVREARAGEQARLNIDSREGETLIGGKAMKKSPKTNRRYDGVLSPDELQKAIEDYKKRRAAGNTDEEEVPEDEMMDKKAMDEEEIPVPKKGETVEEKVQMVKDRRDRRDEEGDPEDEDEAMGIIANQDEDIDALFDIIDSLLAERDFNKGVKKDGCGKKRKMDEEKVIEEEEQMDEGAPVGGLDKLNKLKKNTAKDAEDEEIEEEDLEVDEEEIPEDEEILEEEMDAEDEELVEEEEVMDAEEEELLEEEEVTDEDDIPEDDEEKMNTDSVDKIVRQRIKMGMIGRQLNMDGLENMSIKRAKKAIIRKVNPSLRLDGKSDAYINAAYDMAVKTVKSRNKKGISYQKKQMFNKDSAQVIRKGSSADNARNKMISRMVKSN